MQLPKPENYLSLIESAKKEDLGSGDITSQATIPPEQAGKGNLVFRQNGVLCGMCVAEQVLSIYDKKLTLQNSLKDGQTVEAGGTVAEIIGPLRSMLAAERIILNFLQHLSGIATTTAQYVDAVKGTKAKIYDTRKTTPGWRELEKYAVRCGRGNNHRQGLYDAVLIKDNHLAAMGLANLQTGLTRAIENLQQAKHQPDFIQVEVDNLDQLQTVLQTDKIDMVLLDNMTPDQLRTAVKMRNDCAKAKNILLEASGNITLKNVLTVAQTGIDRISIGALTNRPQTIDIGLDLS